MTNDILWAMEDQCITMMVILDLSAAFDMVDHDILLKILESQFGVTRHSAGSTIISDHNHLKYA